MNLNRLEWSKAQDLLVKLVHVLTPLAERERENSTISSLKQRFFIPYTVDSSSLSHPVSLLKTTLHSAQRQMEEWFEEYPPSGEGKAPVGQKKEGKIPTPAGQPLSAKGNAPVYTGGAKGLGNGKATDPLVQPISLQAQRLIDQVRDAIGTLCTSGNIVHPKAKALRSALLRIKPMIDELIEAVSHEGMQEAGRQAPPRFHFPLPRSPRENLFKKLVDLPKKESTSPKKGEAKSMRAIPLSEKSSKPPFSLTDSVQAEQDKPIEKTSLSLSLEEQTSSPSEGSGRSASPITTLPGAPFTSETRPLFSSKKKKKRKSIWSREEPEEEQK